MYQQGVLDQDIRNLQPEQVTKTRLLLLWPWPSNLHMQTWPVSPEGVPADKKWTSYVKTSMLSKVIV